MVGAVIGAMTATHMAWAVIRATPAARELHRVIALDQCVVRPIVAATAPTLMAGAIVRAAPTAGKLLGSIRLTLELSGALGA
jgi:hypothetical protein